MKCKSTIACKMTRHKKYKLLTAVANTSPSIPARPTLSASEQSSQNSPRTAERSEGLRPLPPPPPPPLAASLHLRLNPLKTGVEGVGGGGKLNF